MLHRNDEMASLQRGPFSGGTSHLETAAREGGDAGPAWPPVRQPLWPPPHGWAVCTGDSFVQIKYRFHIM